MRGVGGGRVGVGGLVAGALILGAAGCSGSGSKEPPQAPPFRGVTITIAAVGDASVLPAVAAQRGEWQASRGGTCVVADTPAAPTSTAGAEVLVFRGERLGDLVAAGALAVVPESAVRPVASEAGADAEENAPPPATDPETAAESDPLRFGEVFPAFRDQVARYGPERVALPLGGSALVLVYNREAFEREANRKDAEAAHVALEPPKTWEDLDRLARFFHGRDWDGDGKDDSGIALALGADPEGVGDAVYLARVAALGQHRDHYSLLFDSDTMAPRVASPPFVEALEALAALKAFGPPGAEGLDAIAARRAFHDGRAALLIDRAERFDAWGGGAVKKVGVAALPGSPRVFDPARKRWDEVKPLNRPGYLPHGGGWLVAVAASAKGKARAAALDFVTYLITPETSNRVRSDRDAPMLPVRAPQVSQGVLDPRAAPGVDPRGWSDAVGATLSAPRVVPGLRIPDADGYLADLAKGRVAAIQGEPAGAALAQVADAWAARTKALGPKRQLWHYRRSLNSLVTTPSPPED